MHSNCNTLKALYISYDGIYEPVGQSQIIPYMASLVKKNIDIFIISFEKVIRGGEKMHSFLQNESFLAAGIHWAPLRYHKSPAIPATLFDICCGILNGQKLIKKNRIKLIHARGYVAGLIAYALKAINNIKFIFDMRGFWPEEKVDAKAWPQGGFLYRFMKYIEKKLVLAADEVVVLTEAANVIIMHKYNVKNIAVIPCCVDLETFSKSKSIPANTLLPQNRLMVIYLGSTGTFYNFEETAKFFQVFKEKMPEAFFLVLSNGNNENIVKILKSLTMDTRDFFVVSIPHKQIPLYLHTALFSMIFYQRILSAPGCCPIKFAESLACGVPILISPGIGDCDRIVQEEAVGVVLKGYSPNHYRLAAEQVYDLLLKRDETALRCYATAKKYFSLEAGVDKYSKLYHKLIGLYDAETN